MHRRVAHWLLGLLLAVQLAAPTAVAGQAQSADDLLVFVGRRISVISAGTEVPPGQPFLFDQKFRARYEVITILWGTYPDSVIEFDVYDHYGEPAFAQYETALLYVAQYGQRLVHEKYLYSPVYETESGTWAGCGDPYALDEHHRGSVDAVPIRFKQEVSFSVDGMTDDEIAADYPPQYFRRHDNRVVCIAGARAEDLFAIKRAGFLRARGVFR